jgi:hypothetical protein
MCGREYTDKFKWTDESRKKLSLLKKEWWKNKKRCPHKNICESWREENPSCNGDYREGYCGISRRKDKEAE